MEPVSLTVAAIIAAVATKAGDRAADAVVDEGEGVLRRIVERVRRRFSDEHDEQATSALQLVERVHDSKQLTSELAQAIDRHATTAPDFAQELAQLVAQARRGGVDVGQISQVMFGDQGTQIAGVSDSQITVTHNAPPKAAG